MSYSFFFEDASMEFPSYQLWLNKKNDLSKRWAMYCREHKHLFGKGLGKGGAKRHKKILRDNSQGITKPAKRGGVKLISGLIYEEIRGVLKIFSKTWYTTLWHTLNMPNARRRPPRCTALETEEWRTDMTEKL